jgi:outer membrane receptor for Fe3+-dicitrate
MKTFLTATLILAFASSVALASDKEAKDRKDTKASATAAKEKAKPTEAPKRQVVLTGSHIKRTVRKDGQVTDGPNSLTIIDQKAIEQSGAADVRQVLARQSSFR